MFLGAGTIDRMVDWWYGGSKTQGSGSASVAVVGLFRVHGYGLVLEDKFPTYGPKGRRAMEGVSAVTPIVSEINL